MTPSPGYRSKLRTKWNKKPVGIRSAYIGGFFAVSAAVLGGVFLLLATLLPAAKNASPKLSSPHSPEYASSQNVSLPSKSQIPCTGKEQSTLGLTKLSPTDAPFQVSVTGISDYQAGIAFPEVVSANDLKELGDAFPISIQGQQGYEVGRSVFDLTISVHRTLQILQMSAFVMRCSPAAAGTLFELPPALPLIPITGMQFVLGSRDPVALQDRLPYEKYFKDHIFEVTPGQPSTFQITGNPLTDAFEWEIDVTVLIGNTTRSFLIGDSGHPFLTTDNPSGDQYKETLQPCSEISGVSCASGWAGVNG